MKKLIVLLAAIAFACSLAFTQLGQAHPARKMASTCLSGVTHEDAFFTPMAARVTVRLNGVIKATVQSQGSGDYTACWSMPNTCLGPDRVYNVTAVEADGGDQSYGSANWHVNDGCLAFHANVHAPDGGGG